MQSAQQKHYMKYIVLPQGWITGLAGLARHLSYINSALPTCTNLPGNWCRPYTLSSLHYFAVVISKCSVRAKKEENFVTLTVIIVVIVKVIFRNENIR